MAELLLHRYRTRSRAAAGGSSIAITAQYIGLLGGVTEGSQHGRPAVAGDHADGVAAGRADVGRAVHEVENYLVRA